MRILLGVVGLLVVVLIVGLLAKQQLRAVQPSSTGDAPAGPAAQPAQALQRQAADEAAKALAAGMQRNRDAEDTK